MSIETKNLADALSTYAFLALKTLVILPWCAIFLFAMAVGFPVIVMATVAWSDDFGDVRHQIGEFWGMVWSVTGMGLLVSSWRCGISNLRYRTENAL